MVCFVYFYPGLWAPEFGLWDPRDSLENAKEFWGGEANFSVGKVGLD